MKFRTERLQIFLKIHENVHISQFAAEFRRIPKLSSSLSWTHHLSAELIKIDGRSIEIPIFRPIYARARTVTSFLIKFVHNIVIAAPTLTIRNSAIIG